MKNLTKIVIGLAIVIGGILLFSYFSSSEKKIARYEKKAEKFKSNLNENNEILLEIINDSVQKIIYSVNDDGWLHLESYNYATNKGKQVCSTADFGKDDKIISKRQINNRLFFVSDNPERSINRRMSVKYVDLLRDELVYVASGKNVYFTLSNEINIERVIEDAKENIYKDREYTLPMELSEQEYRQNYEHQEEIDRQILEEERNRPKEKVISVNFDYDKDGKKFNNVKCEGTSGIIHWHPIGQTTELITVPYGKRWELKRKTQTNIMGTYFWYVKNNKVIHKEYVDACKNYVFHGGESFAIEFRLYNISKRSGFSFYFTETNE